MLYPSIQHFLSTLQENCLLLARHGETDWNSLGLVQGQQDRPLSPIGYRQRKNLFFRLFAVPIHHIFTSSLQRTIETALPISEEKGIAIEKIDSFNEAKLEYSRVKTSSIFPIHFRKICIMILFMMKSI